MSRGIVLDIAPMFASHYNSNDAWETCGDAYDAYAGQVVVICDIDNFFENIAFFI